MTSNVVEQTVKNQKDSYELQTLFDLSKVLNSSLDLKKILNTILLTPMGKLLISKGIILIEQDSGKYEIETLKGLSKELLGKTITIEPFPQSPRFVNELPESEWRNFFKEHGVSLILPILHDEKQLGVIGFGNKFASPEFTPADLNYLYSLSNIAATAVQNGIIFEQLNQSNRKLEKKLQEQNTLSEIVRELNASLSSLKSERVMNLLVYSIMGEMTVNKCLIFLCEENKLELSLNRGFQSEKLSDITSDSEIFPELVNLNASMVLTGDESHECYQKMHQLGIRVLVPMKVENDIKGLIALGEKITRLPYVKDDLDFLAILGNWSMISIETARLIEQEIEKQKIEEELRIASDIQKRLLPKACPVIDGFEISAINISSLQVGGDYFDCIKLAHNLYFLCIADVSGKGVPASLLMSNLQASLHALINTGLDLNQVVGRINDIIYNNTTYDKFITFFGGILDTDNKTFTSVNGGHNPPYLFHKDKSFDTLTEGGLILGMMPNVSYDTETTQLKSGDTIVMYTDGVSEAMDRDFNEFEEYRIEQCILENFDETAEGLMQNLIAAVKTFTKGAPQTDDITIMTLKVS